MPITSNVMAASSSIGPHLNRFSQECVIFEDAYPEGMPTIPIRRTLMTGRRILPFYYYPQHEPAQIPGWHELYYEDVTWAETLHEAGYITALVSDFLHFLRPGRNFHRGYRYFEWERGHSFDFSATIPHEGLDISDIVPDDYLETWSNFAGEDVRWFLNQYKANMQRWSQQGESLIELTARKSMAWLKRNHAERPFFLHMEAFDPHEPWDPPKRFLEKYMPNARGHTWTNPPYADIEIPEEGIKRLRANYAGETECVDHWLGEVLKTIGELGLFDNSIVVFMSDHGALLGEQGQFCKGPKRLRRQATHIPSSGPLAQRRTCRQAGRWLCPDSGLYAHAPWKARLRVSLKSDRGGLLAARDGRDEKHPRIHGSSLRLGRLCANAGMELQRSLESGGLRRELRTATLQQRKGPGRTNECGGKIPGCSRGPKEETG